MKNEDIIFNKIKNAALAEDAPNFDNMDAVWNRIEQKLETNHAKKQGQTWKKIAVAAMIVLCAGTAFLVLNTSKSNIAPVVAPRNEVVEAKVDTSATIEKQNPLIKKNAKTILKKTLEKNETSTAVAFEEVAVKEEEQLKDKVVEESTPLEQTSVSNVANNDSVLHRKYKQKVSYAPDDLISKEEVSRRVRFFESVGVQSNLRSSYAAQQAKTVQDKRQDPLVIVDGEVMKKKDKLNKISEADIVDIEVLKNPLYIINGEEFSEESLFGSNPSSPYSPLNEQEILEIEIFKSKNAIEKFGEKGKFGVVIIKTKNGKPKK
jgi:hypothetical protein